MELAICLKRNGEMKLKYVFMKYFMVFGVIIGLFFTIGIMLTVQQNFKSYVKYGSEKDKEYTVKMIEEFLDSENTFSKQEQMELKRFANQSKIYVTIIQDGIRIFSSYGMGNHVDVNNVETEEIQLNSGIVVKIGVSRTLYQEDENGDFLTQFRLITIGYILFILLLSIFLASVLGKKLARPITQIKENAIKISQNNYPEVSPTIKTAEELEGLSEEIMELGMRLSQQEELRRQLLQDISHELKNPLSVIRGQVEAMLDGLIPKEDNEIKKIEKEIFRINQMVDELNSLNNIESELFQLKLEKRNISEICTERTNAYKGKIRERNIQLIEEIEKDIYGVVDEGEMNQLLDNLLSNSIKYTQDGGLIGVSLRQNRTSIIISIKDNGIGIRQEDLPYVTERFFRGSQLGGNKIQGLGIGLTVVNKIVRLHYGELHIDSTVGKGTEIVVKIPKNYQGK